MTPERRAKAFADTLLRTLDGEMAWPGELAIAQLVREVRQEERQAIQEKLRADRVRYESEEVRQALRTLSAWLERRGAQE